jgi:hypothetical protein
MIGNAEILGVEGLKADFRKYGKDAEKAVDIAVKQTGFAIQSDAKKRLNGMLGSAKHWITGNLAKSIYKRPLQPMEMIVGTPVEYAPYIEFGTGDFVEIPEGTEEVARLYKGKGLRKVNIKGDSFLNWAAVNQQKKLIERIEIELNKLK